MGNSQVHFGCMSAPMNDNDYSNKRQSINTIKRKSNKSSSSSSSRSRSRSRSRSMSSIRDYSHSDFSSTSSSLPTISESTESTESIDSLSTIPGPPAPQDSDEEEMSCSALYNYEHDNISYHDYRQQIKILFLDVDGVLNNPTTEWDEYTNGIDPKLLKYLKLILLKTGCKIVLSTTWRLNQNAKQILLHTLKSRADINVEDIVIGQTKTLKHKGKHRTAEIYDYLKSNQYQYNVISWCAIDDLPLHKYDKQSAKFMKHHFVRTNPKIGISPQNALSCIDILNQNDIDIYYQQNYHSSYHHGYASYNKSRRHSYYY